MILGGAPRTPDNNGTLQDATNTTELIDLSANQPQWVYGPAMDRARVDLNATILPSGKVLVSGGSSKNEVATINSMTTELYDPVRTVSVQARWQPRC
jgi:hypothetical protein